MINVFEVRETNKMIEESNLDVRTITMGISLLDCCDNNVDVVCEKIYRKITEKAANLVKVGEQIELDYGIPIVNKRISVTPIALVGGSCCKTPEDYVKIAKTLDRAAHTVGINFLGGYSALVSKGMTPADKLLIESIPQALAETELVCSSVNVGSTKTGIDMDAVKMLGETVKKTAELTKDNDSLGCAKLVIFCNAPDDNPFMAGAFHGVTEGDVVINVGVSGPGVVKRAIEEGVCTRKDLFITSKMWVQDMKNYETAKKAIDASIEKSGLGYLDLYLLHQAMGDYFSAWRAMEDAYKEGKLKAIGVSNFYAHVLVNFVNTVEIKPMVNQVELHPYYTQEKAIETMKYYDVIPEAWAPLGGGRYKPFEDEMLKGIAAKYNKSVGQVLLRWNVQRGVVVVPKSTHVERIKENIDIFDFELNEEEMKQISSLNMGYSGSRAKHFELDFVRIK